MSDREFLHHTRLLECATVSKVDTSIKHAMKVFSVRISLSDSVSEQELRIACELGNVATKGALGTFRDTDDRTAL